MRTFLSAGFRRLASSFALLAGACIGHVVSAAPSIQSVVVQPDPLQIGQGFTINVAASADVTQATATVDFRPASTTLLRVVLGKQGNDWVGTGTVPASLQVPAGTQATVKVLVFDAARVRAESTRMVGVVTVTSGVSATFAGGILTVTGDPLDNTITVSRNAAGAILVNGGAITVTGGTPTVANTTLIRILGREGHDQLQLNEAGGALPPAEISGEAGNDTLGGGSANDTLLGGSGDDTLLGRGGLDTLLGGDNNDTLIGGDADDQVFGEAGSDRMIWNPGDDTDLNEGGADSDTVQINGGGGAEQFTTTANGTRVRFDRINPAPFSIDIGTSENLVVNANGGDDSFSATGNLAALIQITVDGGSGNDTLLGSNGADVLLGGDNNDVIDGQQGNDVALLGAGDDTFQWDPGDGSDTVEGQAGDDTLRFNGSNGAEIFAVSANGGRVRFSRDLGNIVMDLDDIENLDLNTLGAADHLTVNDLTGTDLSGVVADLAGSGGTGDGAADTVVIHATDADDIVTATLPSGLLQVTGLPAQVLVAGFESTSDTVRIQGLGGDDIIDASAVGSGGPLLALDGGAGHDILLGGVGADTLLGGDQDDTLVGNGGGDVLDGGLGENTLVQDGDNVTAGIVSVFGDTLDNTITISRDAAGAILRDGVAIPGATIANTALIRVFGLEGHDTLTLNEANGALPAAMLFGGAGMDTLNGGSGGDQLFGGAHDDTLLARGGFDRLFGGGGDDTLTGGDADDLAFGETGADRMIWNPGDDTDLNEGGAGSDTVEINGGGGAEQFTTTANGTRVRFDRINPAPFSIDIGTCENLVVNANGGNDSFSATGNLAALIQITVDGGAGDDTLLGSNGVDMLLGGDNNDVIDGQQGNDVAFLGAGDDTFQWDPGDGSDTVEGQAGDDTLRFNGSAGAETLAASANGGRAIFTRNLGNIVMDLDDIENLELHTLGGADSFVVNDLAGTDLVRVTTHLAGTLGGTAGDAQPDVVTVNGTNAIDSVTVTGTGTSATVTGLSAIVTITVAEAALDRLVVNTLGGNDQVEASTLPAGVIGLTLDGGTGGDTLTGSGGVDVLLGGDGDDFIDGRQGTDTVFLGAGDDTFQWDPGDSNDIVEGQDGSDTLRFNGANAAETFAVLANGGRALFTRNVANIVMDLDDVETLDIRALGGADILTVGDLTGTNLSSVAMHLASTVGGSTGDAQADSIVVNGTNAGDTVTVTGTGTSTTVTGLTAVVTVTTAEAALDQLTVNGLGGDDNIQATGLPAGVINLTLNGGLGVDLLIGSGGDDAVNGGDGDDVALMGAGHDTLRWNPGDDNDIVEGQGGLDTLLFSGANVAENIDIFANGGRMLFFRNVASVTMDCNDVEQVDFNAIGGADSIIVDDLTGTDVTGVRIDLANPIGSTTGDAQPDTVIVVGTSGDDVFVVTGTPATGASVLGGATGVTIVGSEAALDTLTLNLEEGDDVLEASGLAAGVIRLTSDGGAGNDILIGSAGNDVLAGGADDDVLLGGPGLDVLDGGAGDNVVIQD